MDQDPSGREQGAAPGSFGAARRYHLTGSARSAKGQPELVCAARSVGARRPRRQSASDGFGFIKNLPPCGVGVMRADVPRFEDAGMPSAISTTAQKGVLEPEELRLLEDVLAATAVP